MSAIEKTKQELHDLKALKGISSALLEISSIKIKSLRENFDTNKVFYDEVSDLYRAVKLSAQKQNYKVTVKEHERSIHIAITSNKRFYGSLNRTVMDAFEETIEKGLNDYLVIGNTGRHYIEETEYAEGCEYLSFKDDYPTQEEMEIFLDKVKMYDKVFIHFPKFTNIFRQDPSTTDITYTTELEGTQKEVGEIDKIYEPELPHILSFFETQVRRLLFTRIMLESELSRTAARLVKMNATEDRATEAIEKKNLSIRKDTMMIEDVRLLETFSSAVQWKKA